MPLELGEPLLPLAALLQPSVALDEAQAPLLLLSDVLRGLVFCHSLAERLHERRSFNRLLRLV